MRSGCQKILAARFYQSGFPHPVFFARLMKIEIPTESETAGVVDAIPVSESDDVVEEAEKLIALKAG